MYKRQLEVVGYLLPQWFATDYMAQVVASSTKPWLLFLGTVSYTHLRAHETVLDLVCRLLLEKKNNPTHSITTDSTKKT